jgi:hypothetical protein
MSDDGVEYLLLYFNVLLQRPKGQGGYLSCGEPRVFGPDKTAPVEMIRHALKKPPFPI